jgi:hypothetical protein
VLYEVVCVSEYIYTEQRNIKTVRTDTESNEHVRRDTESNEHVRRDTESNEHLWESSNLMNSFRSSPPILLCSGIQPGVRVPPGVSEDIFRQIKFKNMYIIS